MGLERANSVAGQAEAEKEGFFTRHWRLWLLLAWIAASAFFIYGRWNMIGWFSLGDTDDNLRMAQVRALMAGQDWYDLRQYKLNPPHGADIHWSRIVDLPIAGIKLALGGLVGGRTAEKVAVAVAPLLPMLVAFLAIGAAARRLIAPAAFLPATAILLCAPSVIGMWGPLRIDHHGWQLAMLALAVAGLVDPKPARGGLTVGLATAVSLSIGLEMLLYLAAAGAITGLMWVRDRNEATRLAAYGASLAGGTALGYLLFASYANRAPVCDALSPVWLSVMVAAGAIGVLLALLPLSSRWGRFGVAAVAALLLAGAYAYFWPHCVGRLERASPELQHLWLSRVREALPLYKHSWKTIATALALPTMGLIGYSVMLWRGRRDETALIRWASIAALALMAAGLLAWQTRASPAAQLLAVPGSAALAWIVIPWMRTRTNLVVRIVGTVAAFAIISGLATRYAVSQIPEQKNGRADAVGQANARCPTLPALAPVAKQPAGLVLTHVDLGPRLITVTRHKAIAGPYHRNGQDIIDIMHAFRGTPENARATIERRNVDYVLICPNLSESTIYRSEAPKGFYVQLTKGQVPAWLEPIDLGKDSPYRMWRVRR
ncbi:MAG TPA: AcrB/AcrD/AcrF family protein [Allosphingosinicella sp.]|uniref:AcrB/AcrD/AcrF family protein n=1 Tax=Allosphingosinicella sp. TaxID=2823234 RepID=UPI002ED902FE